MKLAERSVSLAAGTLLLGAIMISPSCALSSDASTDMSGRASEIFSDPKVLALAEAAEHGDMRTMDRLLKQGVNIDTTGKLGVTATWWAI